jgi:hypothetical protein
MEKEMTGVPHPFFLAVDSELRRLRYHAEADHYRLAQQVRGSGSRLRRWADFTAVLAFVLAVALALASLASPERPERVETQIDSGGPNTVTQVRDEHVLDPTAALAAGESLL